jgi:jumonji domain-containing protein 7
MTLAAYLDLIGSPASSDWSTAQLRRPDPRLLADVDFRQDLLPPEASDARRGHWIFVGSDSYTRLHYHPGTQALLAQLHGKKRLQLYAPEATPSLYPYPWYSLAHNGSAVEDHFGETSRFPRFAQVRPLVVEILPGEIFFIPVHWWHDGQSAGDSITVTLFWRAPLSSWSFPAPGLRDLAHAALYTPVMILERLRNR